MKKREKHIFSTPQPWQLSEQMAEERLCIGDFPLLYVRAMYPVLIPSQEAEASLWATTEAAERFNDCYCRGAQAFAAQGVVTGEPHIRAAFDAAGAEAPHRVMRREWRCRMAAEVIPAEKAGKFQVRVEIQKSFGLRKKQPAMVQKVCEHLWCFPEGFLEDSETKSKRSFKKVAKNY